MNNSLSNNDFIISDLNFSFARDKESFFQDLNVSFPSSKLSFIKGKNGVGKSTLLRIFQGDIYKTESFSGKFFINNFVNLLELKKYINIIPQKYDQVLVKSLSIEDNLALVNLNKYPKFKFIKKNIDQVDYIDLPLSASVENLSGGQKQILAIIMIIMKQTSVLLLDEPTASLDEENSFLVMNFLKDLAIKKNIPIIIVSHNNKIIDHYADLVFSIKKDLSSQKRILLKQ